MKYIICSLLFLSSYTSHAQVLSGLYSGTLINDSTKKVQNYELALSEYKDKITGYSYTTFIVNDTFYYSVKRIKGARENGNLVVEDVQMLMNNFPEPPAKKVRQTVTIPIAAHTDTVEQLNGRWKTNQTKEYYSLHGNLDMKRNNDSAHSALISHLKELRIIHYQDDKPEEAYSAPPNKKEIASSPKKQNKKVTEQSGAVAALPYQQRATYILETVTVVSDSLMLSFYDNGVVDGDTISVYLNEQNIISKTKLTAVASKKVVFTNSDPDKDELQLILVAENLGTIPPNTGLLIIEDGHQKYQIRFSADMQNNAAIVIRKRKG